MHPNLRKADFLNVRRQVVDVKAGILTIPRTKNGDIRRVELNSEARAILLRRPRTLHRSALVFPNRIGGRDLRWVEKTFPRAVAAAYLRLPTPYGGVDILTSNELGGWKSLKMVERYSHIGADHRRAAIERLAHRAAIAEEQPTAAQ